MYIYTPLCIYNVYLHIYICIFCVNMYIFIYIYIAYMDMQIFAVPINAMDRFCGGPGSSPRYPPLCFTLPSGAQIGKERVGVFNLS